LLGVTSPPRPGSGGLGEASRAKPSGTTPDDAQSAPEKRKSRKKRLPKIISRDEARRLMAAVDDGSDVGCRNHLMLELMYRAGLRVAEVTKLQIRDVNPEGLVTVLDGKGGDGTAYFSPGKVNPAMERWLRIREGWVGESTPLLFVHQDGTKISTRYLQRLVKKLKDELGVTGKLTPHVLRHSFATEALEDGFSLVEVQSLMRHANLATTSVYLWVRDDALRKKMTNRVERG
jgi:site-specific recombinase XerD